MFSHYDLKEKMSLVPLPAYNRIVLRQRENPISTNPMAKPELLILPSSRKYVCSKEGDGLVMSGCTKRILTTVLLKHHLGL